MPSKSKSQQRLFAMALAVRHGDLDRSEVGKEVLDIVDGDMTDKQIEDFAKKRTSDRERVSEAEEPIDNGFHSMQNAAGVRSHIPAGRKEPADGSTPIARYLNSLRYAGEMKPIIDVKPGMKYVFVVVKPGFSRFAQEIIEEFEKEGFALYKTRTKLLTEREAKTMYTTHKNEDFYDSLCKYMSSDISIGMLFTYPDFWSEERAFKKTDSIKDRIRKEHSESDMRNVMHSSDNLQNMRLECSMYFNELI